MRGTLAKEIRKTIYGDSPTNASSRKYRMIGKTIIADNLRQRFQYAKKHWREILNAKKTAPIKQADKAMV